MSKRIPTAGVEKAPARSPQAGNNLWITAQPPGVHGSRPVRRACPHPPESGPRWKAPWVLPIALPFAGDRSRRPCRKVSRKWDRRGRVTRKRGSPGGLVNGARFVHRAGRLLQPFSSRVHDRRCPSHAVGVTNLGVRNHGGACSIRRKPDRAPEPRKLGWPGPERDWVTQEAHPEGNLEARANGAREIPVVLVDRRDCRRRRATLFILMRKHGERGTASMEGALVR